jgi:hypothetical protein
MQQVIEVPPDRRGRQAERASERGSGHRAGLQDQPGNPGARTLLGACRVLGSGLPWLSHVFHNIIVP